MSGWFLAVRKSDGLVVEAHETHAMQPFDELPEDFQCWCAVKVDGEDRPIVIRRGDLARLTDVLAGTETTSSAYIVEGA